MIFQNKKYDVYYYEEYVDPITKRTRKHIYLDEKKEYLKSTTKVISIIDYGYDNSKKDYVVGGKSNALIGWAKRESLKVIEQELKQYIGKSKKFTESFILDLIERAKAKPKELLKKAGDYGTMFHSAIDEFINTGNIPILQEEIKDTFQSFINLIEKEKIKFICGDIAIGSMEHRYGARPDALAVKDSDYFILYDWKTSNWFDKKYCVQVAGAYQQALKEQYGIDVKEVRIIKFDKEKPIFKPYKVEKEYFTYCWNAFKHSLELADDLDKIKFVEEL